MESPSSSINGAANDNGDATETHPTHTNYVQSNGYHKAPKQPPADDSDDDDQNGSIDGELAHSMNSASAEPLPNMPKLDEAGTPAADKNGGAPATKVAASVAALKNGHSHARKNGRTLENGNGAMDSDSSSNDSDYVPPKKKAAAAGAAANSVKATAASTPNNENVHSLNRLVPYEDSEYDSGTESPPTEVNTKAGPFQVTSTNRSDAPHVVTAFMRGSPSERSLSNGATSLLHRRESDSNLTVKTAASVAHSTAASKRPNEWHGNETASKLMKYNHRGYGTAVSTWNGQQSSMEKEVNTPLAISFTNGARLATDFD